MWSYSCVWWLLATATSALLLSYATFPSAADSLSHSLQQQPSLHPPSLFQQWWGRQPPLPPPTPQFSTAAVVSQVLRYFPCITFATQALVCITGFIERSWWWSRGRRWGHSYFYFYYRLSDIHMTWMIPILVIRWLVPPSSIDACLCVFLAGMCFCIFCCLVSRLCSSSPSRSGFAYGRLFALLFTLALIEHFGMWRNAAALLKMSRGADSSADFYGTEYLPSLLTYVVALYMGSQRGSASSQLHAMITLANLYCFWRISFNPAAAAATTVTTTLPPESHSLLDLAYWRNRPNGGILA